MTFARPIVGSVRNCSRARVPGRVAGLFDPPADAGRAFDRLAGGIRRTVPAQTLVTFWWAGPARTCWSAARGETCWSAASRPAVTNCAEGKAGSDGELFPGGRE